MKQRVGFLEFDGVSGLISPALPTHLRRMRFTSSIADTLDDLGLEYPEIDPALKYLVME
jgi:hypothetical protein